MGVSEYICVTGGFLSSTICVEIKSETNFGMVGRDGVWNLLCLIKSQAYKLLCDILKI